MIRVSNLKKAFPVERGALRRLVGEVIAVDDVSFRIKKGETVGLVGESGCGKTTLGRLIVGLLKPDEGRIDLEDIERRQLQIIFQDPFSSLDPRMKIKDIILEGPRAHGIKREEQESRLKEMLELTGLGHDSRLKYPHQFSGGERQRISLARALVLRPKFIVLDEPVSNLDVTIQAKILKLLKTIKVRFCLTYLFISHDLSVVETMSDRVLVMKKGKIIEEADSRILYKSPQNPYTKALIDAIPRFYRR